VEREHKKLEEELVRQVECDRDRARVRLLMQVHLLSVVQLTTTMFSSTYYY
jgi:hypothetical protein